MSVQLFSGIPQANGAKCSSRVLAPPGGKSSIFFSDEAAPVQVKASACQAKRNESHVFSPAAKAAPRSPVRAPKPAAAPVTVAESAPLEPPAYGRKASTFNDTRVNGGKSLSVHTSSRVLNPPGGRCNNIFG